jgi:hypothetical protein
VERGLALFVLRHELTGLHINGTASLIVNNINDPPIFDEGAIWINSYDEELCLTATGTPEIKANILNIAPMILPQKGILSFRRNPKCI